MSDKPGSAISRFSIAAKKVLGEAVDPLGVPTRSSGILVRVRRVLRRRDGHVAGARDQRGVTASVAQDDLVDDDVAACALGGVNDLQSCCLPREGGEVPGDHP